MPAVIPVETTPQQLVDLCRETENSTVPGHPSRSIGGADFKKQQDRDGLVGKVVAASIKLEQCKPSDADRKLNDYETTLAMLMLTADSPTKAKISGDRGDILKGYLNAAQYAIATYVCP